MPFFTQLSEDKKLKTLLPYRSRTLAAFAGIAKGLICGIFLTTNIQLQAATFNVADYGAVGDDSTDNTAAFTACLNAVIADGGGKMFIPDGVYRGRITIPPVSQPIPSWLAIEIVGESEPPPVWGTIGSFPLRQKGTIIKSLATSGSAVISAASSTFYSDFSAVHVIIRNLDVRTYNNPQIGGIDLQHALQCRLDNVFINTDLYNVQASQPTHGTKGLITPANNNAALTILRNVLVTGYHTGIVANEHTDGDNITLGSNFHAIEFAQANHASRFGRVCAQRCPNNITMTGVHAFTIEQLDIEKTGVNQTDANSVWQANVYDINDPNNLGIGDIDDWVVVGDVGAVSNNFTRNGGATIRTKRVGSTATPPPPPPTETSPINGSFETPDRSAAGYEEIPVGTTVGGWTHLSGSYSAFIVDQNFQYPAFYPAADGDQVLEFDHRSSPASLIYRSVGTTAITGDVTVSAEFALRNFNAAPLPNAGFKLLLLTGTPGNFTTLADSGVLTHSSVATWVKRSLTASNVPAGTEVFVGLRANSWGTAPYNSSNHVFTFVDDVRVSLPFQFAITDFNYTPETGAVALTWNSQPSSSYRVVGSTGLIDWNHLFGTGIGTAQDQNPSDGDFISFSFNLNSFLLQNEPKLFFRVEEQ